MQVKWLAESGAALSAASDAGEMLLSKNDGLAISTKEAMRDLVTEYDYNSQKLIVGKLNHHFSYPILSEEQSRIKDAKILNNETYWVLDPIDGTVNFAYGIPLYSVSVGLCHQDDFVAGAISIPALKELYFTYGDKAAYMNGKKITCANEVDISKGLFSAGFSGVDTSEVRSKQYSLFGEINDSSRGCLRLGSAAVSICFVVTKKLNATYGLNVKIWDIAAGLAIAKLAGYDVWVRRRQDLISADFIVGTKHLVNTIKELMDKHTLLSTEELK